MRLSSRAETCRRFGRSPDISLAAGKARGVIAEQPRSGMHQRGTCICLVAKRAPDDCCDRERFVSLLKAAIARAGRAKVFCNAPVATTRDRTRARHCLRWSNCGPAKMVFAHRHTFTIAIFPKQLHISPCHEWASNSTECHCSGSPSNPQ